MNDVSQEIGKEVTIVDHRLRLPLEERGFWPVHMTPQWVLMRRDYHDGQLAVAGPAAPSEPLPSEQRSPGHVLMATALAFSTLCLLAAAIRFQ